MRFGGVTGICDMREKLCAGLYGQERLETPAFALT
jgi:hypothetical protein